MGAVAGFRLSAPLETERLVLRAYREDDFDALYAMRSSPEVARYLYWEPQTEAEVRRTLALKIESVSLEKQGDVLALAAEHRESGALVGDVILAWSVSSTLWARSATSFIPTIRGTGTRRSWPGRCWPSRSTALVSIA